MAIPQNMDPFHHSIMLIGSDEYPREFGKALHV